MGLVLLLAAAPLLSGCDEPASAVAAQPAPPPEVSFVSVTPQPFAVIRELPGRIAPMRVADVRPQVSGIIVERLFHQGSDVKAGDPLYRIDSRPFQVDLMAQEAALAKAEAVLDQASRHARRIETLTQQHVASEAQHETAIAAKRQAEADVAARRADVARARLNLGYATIRAPIDGRIGAALVSEGALVAPGDTTTNLASIQQLDPIYADFTQSVSDLNKLRRAFARGDLEQIAPGAAKIKLIVDDGVYSHTGKLLFSEAKVNAETGQVTLRGEFPNPNGELLSGMYVRVLIEQGIDTDAIAVPQQAVQRGRDGGSEVFVVRPDNRIAVQAVRTGAVHGGQWLITDGLKAGDRVVVEGFQKFAAGDEVRPLPLREVATGSIASDDFKVTPASVRD
ncbi:MAG: efflux RND transporter periplasmic adaptor subunit [Xanthobacteraceae bacterium]|nr:efflux RND transporter periplasmic adaptor subunit [Xanthobacteraceae bacterium]